VLTVKSSGFINAKLTAWLAFFVFVFAFAITDGFPLLIAHATIPDNTREVAARAAEGARGRPVTPATAEQVYEYVTPFAAEFGLSIARKDFRVLDNGKVTVTCYKNVDTFFMDKIPALAPKTVVSSTVTTDPYLIS
jgi:hypothetical protein